MAAVGPPWGHVLDGLADMLDFFRQRGLSNVIYGAIIVATIFAFVVTFRPNATSRTASLREACAARVRGRCLDPKDFGAAYRILMPSRSSTMSRKLNLKRIALDGLIERELLDDEAKRLGLHVTDAEVTDQLYSGYVRVSVPAADPVVAQTIVSEMYQSYARAGLIPADVAQARFNDRDTAIPVDFRDPKTKAFDMKAYERQVRNLSNRSTTEFREEQARELLAAKMRDVVREPVRVSETEAWKQYEQRYTTATVSSVAVKESWARRWGVDAKPQDVEAWVKDHQAEFDKALAERRADAAPKAGHVRHILAKLPYGASDDEKAHALAKLSWAAARIKAGEPFAEVAREMSDDPGSAMKGGDVGEKTDSFVPPFKNAADALKPGDSTGAVETQFGFHLISKDDPAKAPAIEAQVKRSLAQSLYAGEKATGVARAIAGRIDEAMRAGKSADEAIRAATVPYLRDTKLDALRVVSTSAAPASRGSEDAGASNAEAQGAADPATAQSKAHQAGPPNVRFDAATDTDRPQVETSSAFNRGGDPFPGLSPDGTAAVVRFAFSAADGDVLAEPVRTADAFVVVQLKQHKTATRDEFEKDREAVEEDLLRAKRDEAISSYVKRLRERAKEDIKIDESYVQEVKGDGRIGGANDEEEEY
ncbi:MAG: peptidylprolyl isomerase [Myxococcota bacterium]|nr:peptidylprolyl isomerase [Myxococcota bacterium]